MYMLYHEIIPAACIPLRVHDAVARAKSARRREQVQDTRKPADSDVIARRTGSIIPSRCLALHYAAICPSCIGYVV